MSLLNVREKKKHKCERHLNLPIRSHFCFYHHTLLRGACQLWGNFSQNRSLLFIFAPKAEGAKPPLCHTVYKLAFKVYGNPVLHLPIVTPARGHAAAETPTVCHVLKQDTKRLIEEGGLWSHCQSAVTRRTCIISYFLSLSFWLSFSERCKWCACQSLSGATSGSRPLQQGLWR